MQIPTLETERLILRPPALADEAAYASIMMSDRAVHMGGPFTREDSWLDFCAGVAGWHLRGFGTLSMSPKSSDEFLGLVFMHHEFDDPEQELGWIVNPKAEGLGYAFEAGCAIRDYVFDVRGWDTAVSYIAPENTRSIALAERLGAVADAAAKRPPSYPECLVYRHQAQGNDGNVEAYV